MRNVERKLFNVEQIRSYLEERYSITKDPEVKEGKMKLNGVLPYGSEDDVENFLKLLNEKYGDAILKIYEQGVLDGIKLSYEIKEND